MADKLCQAPGAFGEESCKEKDPFNYQRLGSRGRSALWLEGSSRTAGCRALTRSLTRGQEQGGWTDPGSAMGRGLVRVLSMGTEGLFYLPPRLALEGCKPHPARGKREKAQDHKGSPPPQCILLQMTSFPPYKQGRKKKLNLPHGISQEFQCRSIKMFCFKLHRNMTIPCRIFNYLHSTVSPEIQDTAKVY